ncbi:MAG: hypothetical protein JW891_00665 [Candidatus Lokiarchaeota archaeon]|nr:hypothetical protein [Candidatus Lokiarchaeota archaeon]
MPIKVAFMQLSSCWGCHQSLLNAHLGLLNVLPELEIVYWPAVVDFKLNSLKARKDGEIVVGFLEGAVRTSQDKANVELMRKKCAVIVAFGACACHGSVLGLANLSSKEDLLKRKFTEVESISSGGGVPTINVPEVEDHIVLIKDIIDVDVFLPGCPPTTENILAAVSYLLTVVGEGPASLNKNKSVCDSCSLAKKGCLLDSDILCYGSITAAGCEEMCPNKGEPCIGCYKATTKPGAKATQLKTILDGINSLTPEMGKSIQHFLDLYLGVANIGNFYFRGDLLQRMAYEPESLTEKEVGGHIMLDVAPTGVQIIDDIAGEALYLLKDDPNFKYSSKTVCSHCERDVADKVPGDLKRDYEGLPTMDKCFLEQGYICLGPVTHAGCGTICPNKANAPCLGCYGPPVGVKEQGAKFISTLGSLCADKDPQEVLDFIKDPAGLFNRFTLAASTLGYKRNDLKEDK